MRSRAANLVLLACLISYCLLSVVGIAVNMAKQPPDPSQWDFEMYYYTTKAYFEGVNPYDGAAVAAATGKRVLDYYYFPLSFYLFRPFISIDFKLAAYIFLGLKCILLIVLLLVWQRFLGIDVDFYFCLFCTFAYNSTIYLDFEAGNISTIEQLLLWSALLNLIRDRVRTFCLLLTLACLFKVNMAIFGLIILLMPRNVRWKGILYFSIMLGAAVLICALSDWPNFIRFTSRLFQVMKVPWDVGTINPSSFIFITAWFKVLSVELGIQVPRIWVFIVYIAWVICVVGVSWGLISKLNVERIDHRKIILMLFCVAYALVIPRFKDYSYILLIPPTYFIILNLIQTKSYTPLFLLCILSASSAPMPGASVLTSIMWTYYPFLLGTMVWLLYVFEIRRQRLDGGFFGHDLPADTGS